MRQVPSGPTGCARAGHFDWQNRGGNFKQGENFARACIFSPHMATTKQLKKWPGDIADAKHRYLSNTNATATPAGTTSSRICKMLPPKRRWVSESRKDNVHSRVIQEPCTYVLPSPGTYAYVRLVPCATNRTSTHKAGNFAM